MTERHPETGTDQTPTPDAIRERHQPVDVPYATGRQVCTLCLQRWPCDAIVALDDADRLAEALEEVEQDRCGCLGSREDVLRQHVTRQTPPETERLAVGLAGDQLDLAKSGLSPEMPGPGYDVQTRRSRDPDRGVYGEPDE